MDRREEGEGKEGGRNKKKERHGKVEKREKQRGLEENGKKCWENEK